MSAGVHLTRNRRAIGNAGLFFNWQSVHVCAQTDGFHVTAIPRFTPLDNAHDTRASEARHHLVTSELAQTLGDERRSAVHVVHQFRMRMQITPPAHDFRLQIGDAVQNGHGGNLISGTGKHNVSTSPWPTQHPCKRQLHRIGLYRPPCPRP